MIGQRRYIEAANWRDIRPQDWPWPNFPPLELACRGTGRVKVAIALMDGLQAMRATLGRPMMVNSGFRDPDYNRRIGGASGSKHMLGEAVDIAMALHDPQAFHAAARMAGFKGFGFYPETHNRFMHIDLGPPRWWGDPGPWGIAPLA